jgi:cytochrome P450
VPWPERSAPLFGEDFTKNPSACYERLRRDFGPVAPVTLEETGALRGYLVLDHAHQLDILHNRSQVWSRDSRWYRDLADGVLPADHPLIPQFAYRRSRLCSEGEEHERRAGPGNHALAELDQIGTRELIEDLAGQLIDTFPAGGQIDVLRDYALQLPLLVTMRLMGMDEDSALAAGNAIHEVLSAGPGAHQAAAELDGIMRALVAAKQQDPGPDLVSWMHHHNQRLGNGMDLAEMCEDVWLQILATRGASTTWICNTVLELLTNPELNADVGAGRWAMAEAMNHVMWTNAPVQNLIGRWATRATTLGPYAINAGDMAILSLGAASGDPALRGLSADVSRSNKAHLAWSAGIHGCPAPARELGTLIVRTALEILWERLPGLRLAVARDELGWELPYNARMPTALPVTFPPPPAPPKEQPWAQRQPSFISSPPRPTSTETKARPSGRQGRLPRWRSLVAWWPRR